jgi:hypothetical protein
MGEGKEISPRQWLTNGVAGEHKQIVFYWNGITDRNVRAAPGIYRVITYMKYHDGRETVEKEHIGNIGIGK